MDHLTIPAKQRLWIKQNSLKVGSNSIMGDVLQPTDLSRCWFNYNSPEELISKINSLYGTNLDESYLMFQKYCILIGLYLI